jgi:hypothetical protein
LNEPAEVEDLSFARIANGRAFFRYFSSAVRAVFALLWCTAADADAAAAPLKSTAPLAMTAAASNVTRFIIPSIFRLSLAPVPLWRAYRSPAAGFTTVSVRELLI